jgi:tetratricopeptide (TPR) repeat protein
MHRAGLATLLALAVAAAAAPALAQSAKEEAARLFSEGNALYDNGDFAGALKKFEAARARYPSYKIDLNIATALVELGRPAEAAETYEVFLQRGSAQAPTDILVSARGKLDELKARLGRVTVSSPVSGATIKVDGKAAGTTPRDRPIYLQPGAHRLEACKAGHACAAESVTVAAGEQRELTLAPREEAGAATDTGTSAATDAATGAANDTGATVTASADTGRPGSWKATAGWVTLGVGGAAVVTGVIFGVMVSSKSDEHAQAIEDGKTYGELQDISDSGKRYQTLEIATLVVGGVALAAGGGLLLWHYLGGKKESSSAAFVAPMVGTDVRGLVGGLRF